MYPKFHLLVFTCIFTLSSMYILISTFIIPCMYLYLMHMICWAVFVWAIKHPIKLFVAKLHHYSNHPGRCITIHHRVNYKNFHLLCYIKSRSTLGHICTHRFCKSIKIHHLENLYTYGMHVPTCLRSIGCIVQSKRISAGNIQTISIICDYTPAKYHEP